MTVYVKYIIDILTILFIIILSAVHIKVLTMNNSIQEKKGKSSSYVKVSSGKI
ncbi:hypothetical protein wTpre_96 [Wolbachia endosymbiont of Trichogramma pretiosum]|nr:hypothetical protein wTpre_96 [Wolbachia endosymbiont of Trichogramma pretiosum]